MYNYQGYNFVNNRCSDVLGYEHVDTYLVHVHWWEFKVSGGAAS